jgi:hypothetical protein
MSYAATMYLDAPAAVESVAQPDLIFVQRSRLQWAAFLVPAAISLMSWLGGGVPPMTDLAFLIFTLLCGFFLAVEFYRFPRRFGIGGLLLWGGTLCWFCEDYFVHWFGKDFRVDGAMPIRAVVIAKTAFLLISFTMFMAIGLGIRTGRWLEKLIVIVPEVQNRHFYLLIVGLMFVVGLSPYYLFNAEPAWLCIFHAATSGWTGYPALTVYRTGNLNYNWGGYAAQLISIGQVGGVFAIMYVTLLAKAWWDRALALIPWLFWLCVSFQTDRRGEVAFVFMPAISLLFIKFQAQAAAAFRKFSWPAYIFCGLLTVILYVGVQYQGSFRGVGLNNGSISTIELGKNQGNTMFSEGLIGFGIIGETHPFFYNDFPGEGAILPIPRTLMLFMIGPIPRALWHDKWIDPSWAWYNRTVAGGNGTSGTTISHGLVGGWYFNYGAIGMVEGALLVGWLMGVTERALQHSNGKPIAVMMSLGVAVWLFRTYRDFIFIDLYSLMVGALMLGILTYALRPFFDADAPAAAA